ncbi:MAG: type I secretion system permease/ATPase [Rubrivivax sp.]|nr:type I secretion system permease/ATPase [Rubrivivax sp.]
MNWLFLPPLRRAVAWAAFASLLLNLALVVPSLYMLQVFDRVFASRSIETLAMLTLFAALALALGLAADRARSLWLARAGRDVEEALAGAALAAQIEAVARRGADADGHSALPDIARLRGFLAGPAVTALFDAPWVPLYLALIWALHPVLGATALGAALALAALGVLSERLLRADSERATAAARASTTRVERLLRHAEVLAAMRIVPEALGRWAVQHDRLQQAQDRLTGRMATLGAVGRGLRQAVQVAMLALGAWLVVAGHATPGVMVAATVLVSRALQPVEQLVAGWKQLLEVRAAWARLREAMVEPCDDDALHLPAPKGRLVAERLTLLQDPQRPPLLRQVSLTVDAGECLGIVGPSGSGKTTLLRALLGLRTPTAGAVRIDGVDLAQWRDDDLAGAIGYLPQDVELFDGTVAQNIARLGVVDDAAVLAAAQAAGVHEMVSRLPDGYATELGDAGARLSGGQRQRLGLARALYGGPRLVLLDEPNAHLDRDGEAALAAALAALKAAGTTVVMVSHRASLLRQADRIAVLRDGAVEAIGPRDEMLARLDPPAVHPRRRPAAFAEGAGAASTVTPIAGLSARG